MPFIENLPQLFVNDGVLDPENVAFLKPTSLDTPLEEMRRRFEEDDYVFVKGLIPRSDVLKAREEYFELLSASELLEPGTDPVDGIFNSSKDSLDYPGFLAGHFDRLKEKAALGITSNYVDLGLKAHTESWYKDELCHHPALTGFAARFTGWGDDMLELQRSLLRSNTPGNKAIGVHYDRIFLRDGEDSVLTAWVPIGDIKVNGGGLIYLEKREEIEEEFTEKAKASGMSQQEAESAFNQNMMSGGMLSQGPIEFGGKYGRKWLVADYEAGDVVFHNAYSIHASTTNHDPDGKIRLSSDIRFVNTSRPFDNRWTKDFEFGDGL